MMNYSTEMKENAELFESARIGSIKKLDKIINDFMEAYDSELVALVTGLIHKGLAYDQTRWERDVAISQLAEIGIELGEKTNHIVHLIEQGRVIEDDGR